MFKLYSSTIYVGIMVINKVILIGILAFESSVLLATGDLMWHDRHDNIT